MPQDAYTLRRVALALDGALAGGKIGKIVQPSKDEVFFYIYTGKQTFKLCLNANASDCGAYFCEDGEAPLSAPNFCMLLRKHLHGAELVSVSLTGFERVMRFRFSAATDFTRTERELLLEVMGKYSNLILTENGVILGALKTNALDTSCKRIVFAGVKYVPPAKQDKADPSDPAALRLALAHTEGDLAHAIFTRLAGLAPVTAEQIAASFRGGDLAEHVGKFLFEAPDFPCVSEKDFFACRAEGAVPFPSLLEAEEFFYTRKRGREEFEGEKRKLSSVLSAAVKKAEKRLALLLEKELSCRDCEENRRKGELLTAYLWKLSRGMKSCTLPDFTDGKEVTVALDERLSPSENAQSYFKKYRKQKRTLQSVLPQKEQAGEELEYLKSVSALLSSAREKNDLLSLREELLSAGLLSSPQTPRGKKASPAKEIPFRVYEKEGFRILAGRNNLQNDRLVRSCSPDDLWFHAQRYHSCHAVVRTEGKEVPESVLQFAADVCAKFSDGGGDRIPVDCCPLKFVKKPKGAKAGFVLYSRFKTLLGDPKEM